MQRNNFCKKTPRKKCGTPQTDQLRSCHNGTIIRLNDFLLVQLFLMVEIAEGLMGLSSPPNI